MVAGEREGRREMMEGVGQHSFLPLLPSSFEDEIASSGEDVEEDGYVYWVDKEVAGAGDPTPGPIDSSADVISMLSEAV